MSVIAFAAGGTAGHIEPAIACAKAVKELNSQTEVFIIGTDKGLEKDLVPHHGIELVLIPATPLSRKLSFSLLTLPFRYLSAERIAIKVLQDRKVDCVVGFGAYVSLPVYNAASKLKIPVIVHEGNKKPGLANQIGSKIAKQVFQMFPDSLKGAQTIGMPVRKEISNLNREKEKNNARQYFGLAPEKATLLVFGGSQGSQSINKALVDSLPELESLGIQILHAVGSKNSIDEKTQKYSFYFPVSYIKKMELAYAACDLVISRAGAMTIAEQTILGIPAIYVPFPTGNGEQIKNVSALIASGAGALIEDANISSPLLVGKVKELFQNPKLLQEMSINSSKYGLRDADVKVAQSALALASAH